MKKMKSDYVLMKDEVKRTTATRPQDQSYSQDALAKAFGKKLTREQYLKSLRKQFDRKDDE